VFEGRNIHQFTSQFSGTFRFWASPPRYRELVGGKGCPKSALLDYQTYRLGFRKIARNTDERTMIATVLPPCFVAESVQTVRVVDDQGSRSVSAYDQLYLCAIFNSFVFDSLIRLKVTANMNFFLVYSTQVPDVRADNALYGRISERAARLVCTAMEFDALAGEIGLGDHTAGATDPAERARLRAELDGLVAHLYGLTEEEFAHILGTFPLVDEAIKVAARNAYRDVERGLIQ
jgi:hypothetical protein